jgi:pimeloyl-ACP methyl ester carboxylesterase
VVRGGHWRPGVTLEDDELARIKQPVLYLWGTADPLGSADIWSRAMDALPAGELRVVEGAGHTPWLDAPEIVADHVQRFLA